MPRPKLRFGPFTLLPGEQRLLRDGVDVPLGPRAFGVLCQLAQRPGRVVTKDELLATVWRGLVVVEANLHVQVSLLRKAIGAEAIVTVSGLGYRFALPVESHPASVPVSATPTTPAAPSAPRRLSVIVLPFVESGATADQEYFADAITDDVTTQLSKIKGSTVIASPTAMAYKHERFDVSTLARELGVRYVLQGRLERTDEAVEANVRLSDAATGAVIWSDAIEAPKSGVAHLRRELVARLANALNLQLMAAEQSRIEAENAPHPEALDLVMQAWASGGNRADIEHRLARCDRALQIQPGMAGALVARARNLAQMAFTWPGPDRRAQLAQAESDITQALAQDSLDSESHAVLGVVRRHQLRFDAARVALDQALALNPSHCQALAWRGAVMIYTGEANHAPEPLARALALSPRDPARWWWLCYMGVAHLCSGRYEEAVRWLEKSLAALPYWSTALYAVAAYAHLGRDLEARATLGHLLERDPEVESYLRDERLSDHETYLAQRSQHFVAGLAKVGAEHLLGPQDEWVALQRRSRI